MRIMLLAGAAAVLVASSPPPAHAYTIVAGSLAGACSADARQGRTGDAVIARCTEALDREPLNDRDRAGTYVNRGAVHLMRKETAAAEADFDAAARLFPTLGEAYVGRGGVLIAMERWAQAEAEITRGLDLGVEQAEKAYYFRGVARWGQDDLRGAYFDFRKAEALAPGWKAPAQELSHFKVSPAR
jgi:tetratricopeptide (TPR) repeat protein